MVACQREHEIEEKTLSARKQDWLIGDVDLVISCYEYADMKNKIATL